ncbi:hypothetical protein GAYE_SCF03G2389 [Galdieria yellowstonensis]|uniref:Uncharacterized protein n=1 Tax=Galdieria yellowstonensis TaxID=3028027 RepID=A0AAV9IAX1_9RHOD|nr:hypothetical protein GAYE_SCF03G2389 [Galdieria yellowstonensis]
MPTEKKAEAQVPRGTKSGFVPTSKTSTLPFKWNYTRSRRLLCTIYPENQADSISVEGSPGSSRVPKAMQEKMFKYPLIRRSQPVAEVLKNFLRSYIYCGEEIDTKPVVRPLVSFATQCCGMGKTTLGVRFRELLLTDRERFVRHIVSLPGFHAESNFGELAVNALINETLYISLDLRQCPRGKCFEETLEKWITEEVVFQYPNCSELLSKDTCGRFVENILHATNKRYLFLFIDENGALKEEKLRSFDDLSEIDKFTGRPNPFRSFFRSVHYFACQCFVICLIAGIPKSIVDAEEYYALSPLSVEFIDLNPFSKNDIESFVRGTTYGNDSVLRLLFPSCPQGINWFFEMIHGYTAGIPAHVVRVMRELTNLCTESKEFSDLSRDEMKKTMEKILPDPSLSVTSLDMTPNETTKFCALLLASVWELPVPEEETFRKELNLFPDVIYVLDTARSFGFHFVKTDKDEFDEADSDLPIFSVFKLMFPKIVLRYIGKEYWENPCFRFISCLFASISDRHVDYSRKSLFKIVFSLILYTRLSCCERMGELSIFGNSLVENVSMQPGECSSSSNMELVVKSVPAVDNYVDDTHAGNAWQLFYEQYLSRDGIYLPDQENSYGSDVLIRITDFMQNSSITYEGDPFSKQVSLETVSNSLQKQKTYLIGISLKCYDDSCCAVSHEIIKEEVAKFLYPVSSQLDLENNVTVIQLIVSDIYTPEICSYLKDNQSWILDSGVYYEDGNGQLTNLSLSSQSFVGSHREWLTIPSGCQLVICSPQSLTEFLGGTPDNKLERLFCNSQAWWEHFKLLWTLLENSLRESLKILSSEKSKQDAGAVAQGKSKKMKAVSSSVGSVRQGKFDWMEFLKTYCDLTESEASECSNMLRRLGEEEMEGMDSTILQLLGFKDPIVRARVVAGIRSYIRNKPHT